MTIYLGRPYTAWLIVSLSYIRLWSMWSVCLVFWDYGFHSVCPQWIRIRGLWKLPNGGDWLWGKDGDYSHEIKRCLLSGRKAMARLDSILKSKDITLLTKFCIVKAMLVIWIWELDHKEGRVPKNWCFWIVMLEKSPLYSKIKLVSPKGNQFWIFIGRTDAEAEVPILWPPGGKCWLPGKPWGPERLRARGEGDSWG